MPYANQVSFSWLIFPYGHKQIIDDIVEKKISIDTLTHYEQLLTIDIYLAQQERQGEMPGERQGERKGKEKGEFSTKDKHYNLCNQSNKQTLLAAHRPQYTRPTSQS